MILRNTFLGLAVPIAVRAAQPGAVAPVPAPIRDLVWGKLNFLHTTDTHGWLGGHLQEPQYSADWGDYISFSHHLRARADDEGVDVILVDTGDRVEGNGLYDASTPKGLFQYGIYAEQDVDVLCTGNHELYQAYSADREHNTTVPAFKDNYIASNLDYIDPTTGERVPQAQRYRRFKTKNQAIDIIAFGFIFDFTGNANNTIVQKVEDTVKEKWFQDAIREKPDIFLVTGHVGLRMDEFKTIFKAMRKEDWDTPIVFLGGHAHVRDALSYGSRSFSMASGRYMETIGWLSVDGFNVRSKEPSPQASLSFNRRYIDNNLYGMYHHSGKNETTFPTKHGQRVSESIARARTALSLDHVYGCAPRDLWMNRAKYPSNESIYSWIGEELFPAIVVNNERKDKSRLAIMNTGGIRFDIFAGQFTRDATYVVSPFISGFKYVADVPYEIASKVLDILNSGTQILGEGLDTRFLTIPQQRFTAEGSEVNNEDSTHEEASRLELRHVQEPLATDDQPNLMYGYTTKDDIGTDGDDTVHEPLKFHKMPNCIQSQIGFPEEGDPEVVDLVFIDFIQPWVVAALKFSGGDFTDKDVGVYMDGTFTYKMAEWIRENWQGEC